MQDEDRILKRAIETYGEEHQILVAVEELSELQKALLKFLRINDTREYYEDRLGTSEVLKSIEEEMADVEIMLEQLKLMFQSYELVEDAKEAKLKRLEERLNVGDNL